MRWNTAKERGARATPLSPPPLPLPPPVTFSAVTPTAAAIAAKIKEAAKTKERCGYLTKQIVVSSWGRVEKSFPQEGESISPFYRAVLSFPGPRASFVSRQFNVIRGSLVPAFFSRHFRACQSWREEASCASMTTQIEYIGAIESVDRKTTDPPYFLVACAKRTFSPHTTRHPLNLSCDVTTRSLVRARARTRIVRTAAGGQLRVSKTITQCTGIRRHIQLTRYQTNGDTHTYTTHASG